MLLTRGWKFQEGLDGCGGRYSDLMRMDEEEVDGTWMET